MKRYLVFAWWEYEASGGWDDLRGQTDTLAEALALVPADSPTTTWNWHIVRDGQNIYNEHDKKAGVPLPEEK